MLSIKMKPFEQTAHCTLQKDWIEGKGILLWLGLFFMELGAALFLVSSFFSCLWGQALGWIIAAVLGGGTHVLFLGHPFRAIRAFKRPGSSWISRGLFLISLFQLFGFIHIVLGYFATPIGWILILACIFAGATIAYGGYEVADVKPIKTWHSSLLPIQLFARSGFVAFAIMLMGYIFLGQETLAGNVNVKYWMNIALIVNVALFLLYILNLFFDEGSHRLALQMMMTGDLKGIFWVLVVTGGMIIPLIIALISLGGGAGQTGTAIYFIAVLLQFIADPMLRYCSMRSGYYEGLFPVKPIEFPKATT